MPELRNSPITLTEAPASGTLEVSLFGPGRGESVAVHMGEGRWLIVDSCINRRTKSVPVLAYLSDIGVDPATQVKLVVATHAHDDHFAGISQVYQACESATFVCPAALSIPEFIALTDVEEIEHTGLPVRAFSEYRRVFQIIDRRIDDGFEAVQYAMAQRVLYEDPGIDVSCKVIALSPSDRTFRRAMRAIRKSLPRVDVAEYRECINPNDLSITLRIEAGGQSLLLGADMLSGPRGSGWHAVIAGPRPAQKASLFKVSHHGSVTGHRGGVWSELLVKRPLAIMTPYRSSGLPKGADCRRILKLTPNAYVTASQTGTMSPEARQEAADLGSLAQNARELDGEPGHIQARSAVGSGAANWTVVLVEPAKALKDYLAELEPDTQPSL